MDPLNLEAPGSSSKPLSRVPSRRLPFVRAGHQAIQPILDIFDAMRRRSSRAQEDEESFLIRKPNGQEPLSPVSRQQIQRCCQPQLGCFVYVAILLIPFLSNYNLVPALIWKIATVSGLAFLLHRMLIFKRWADEYVYVKRFVVCFSIMIVELLWENVMVWIVSATDMRKYDDPPGLQDNGEILFNALSNWNSLLGWFLNIQWVTVAHFLGVVLALAFSVGWDQHPYSGFGVIARFSLTITISRLIRVASFMSTVLPSPRPGCYRRRFPPPPDTLWGMLHVGMWELRGFGGCNDLVFSGHGAFWTMGPLVFQTYYPGHACNWLLWLALIQVSIKDVIDKQHYTVDMVLAPVVTAAVWTWLEWVYPESKPLPKRPPGAATDPLSPAVVAIIVVALVAGAVIVFVGKT